MRLISYLVCTIGGGAETSCRHEFESHCAVNDQYRLAAAATFFMAASGTFLVLFFATHRKIFALLTGSSEQASSGYAPRSTRSDVRDTI